MTQYQQMNSEKYHDCLFNPSVPTSMHYPIFKTSNSQSLCTIQLQYHIPPVSVYCTAPAPNTASLCIPYRSSASYRLSLCTILLQCLIPPVSLYCTAAVPHTTCPYCCSASYRLSLCTVLLYCSTAFLSN